MTMPKRIKFPPLENGLDYLTSVVDHLRGEPDQRDLKYAVLHLQAAVEVLLKARLIRQDWSLVFKDPNTASQLAFAKGDFQSIGLKDTLTRLTDIGVEVPKPAQDQFYELANRRNKLQHFGMDEQAILIESLAGKVLDSLLCVIRDYLRPGADPDDEHVLDTSQELIRTEMERINGLVAARLARIEPELADRASVVVCCPICQYEALPIDHGDLRCRFCDRTFEPHDAASEYAATVLGLDFPRPGRYEGDGPLYPCTECGVETMVPGVTVRSDPNAPVWVCFNCGPFDSQQEIGECPRCGELMLDTDDGPWFCETCMSDIADPNF